MSAGGKKKNKMLFGGLRFSCTALSVLVRTRYSIYRASSFRLHSEIYTEYMVSTVLDRSWQRGALVPTHGSFGASPHRCCVRHVPYRHMFHRVRAGNGRTTSVFPFCTLVALHVKRFFTPASEVSTLVQCFSLSYLRGRACGYAGAQLVIF